MKTKLPLLVFSTAFAAFICIGGGTRAAEINSTIILPTGLKNPKPYSIIQQPESIIARKGAFVAFSVRVYPEDEVVSYKWQFQKVVGVGDQYPFEALVSQTRELFLPSARMMTSSNAVGAYSVVVTWKNGSTATSSNAFLSVYEVRGGNSTSGTLTKSVSDFVGGLTAGESSCSDSHPTWIFNRVYVPADGSGAVNSFYGPGISTGLEVGPFINTLRDPYLKIDTTNNFPARTMVRFWKNFFSPIDGGALDCEAGPSDVLPILEYYNMTNSTDINKQYKASIYYDTTHPPNPGQDVAMHWKYFH